MGRIHRICTLIVFVCVHAFDFIVAQETTVADYFGEGGTLKNMSCPPISTPQISLNLSYFGLENLQYAFLTSENLTDLSLDHNKIKTISSDSFQGLPRLAHLSLSSNNIQHLDLADFGNLKNLETLRLDGNCKIVAEETTRTNYEDRRTNWTDNDDDFRSIDAYNPQEQRVSENRCMFFFDAEFPKLTHLHLENNNLKSLVFRDGELTSLTHLYLSGNPLNMSNDTGAKLSNFAPSVRYLRLDNCGLRELDVSTLKYVTEMHLENNEFQSICNQYCDDSSLKLEGAVNLDILSLHSNKISKVEDDSFHHTVNLTILDLSYNKIAYIRPDTFAKLERLKSLNLSGNALTKITGPSFKGLRNMRVLDLGCNQIQHIDNNAFQFWFMCEKLLLHNNLLASIENELFSHLFMLKYLDLSYNQFHDVNKIYTRKRSWDNLSVEELNLSGNPLNGIPTSWFDKLSIRAIVYFGNEPSTCSPR